MSRWMVPNPLSPFPSFMTGNRISSPFCLNDHFVASMSPSLKLSLLEHRHGWQPRCQRSPNVILAIEPVIWADRMRRTRWKVLYARPPLSRQSKNTSIFINVNTEIEVGCSVTLASQRCDCAGRSVCRSWWEWRADEGSRLRQIWTGWGMNNRTTQKKQATLNYFELFYGVFFSQKMLASAAFVKVESINKVCRLYSLLLLYYDPHK